MLGEEGVRGSMADILGGSMFGREIDPITGKPLDPEETENFVRCPACGDMIDVRDLAVVMAHLRPLPHPGQDQTN